MSSLLSPSGAVEARAAEQTTPYQQFLAANTFPRRQLQLPDTPKRRSVQ